ncbi:MAG: hypothetical protein NTY00_06880 [Deltaproteobacteria bacterium]|nr:hypothetical protein [Deltaproteobacteria bacterium]
MDLGTKGRLLVMKRGRFFFGQGGHLVLFNLTGKAGCKWQSHQVSTDKRDRADYDTKVKLVKV